jgi:hypothetical protein
MITEYEIADLAVSTQAIYWQQAEVALGSMELVISVLERFMTLLSGFLLVAYFLGSKLTPVQTGILTALYLFWMSRMVATLDILVVSANTTLGEMRNIAPELVTDTPPVLPLFGLMFLLTAGSLYFMWTVRHPNTG